MAKPQVYKSISTSGLSAQFRKVSRLLSWTNFTSRSYRNSFIRQVQGKIPDEQLKYLLGHKRNSIMANTVYQAPDRSIDLTAIGRGNMAEDMTLIDHHASVAWGAKASSQGLSYIIRTYIAADKLLPSLIENFAKADLEVKAELGMDYEEASQVYKVTEYTVLKNAFEAFSDLLTRFNSLIYCNTENDKTKPTIGAEDMFVPSPTVNIDQHIHDSADAITNEAGMEPLLDDLAQRIQQLVNMLTSSHPLATLSCENDTMKSCQNVIKYFLSLLESEMSWKEGLGPYCKSDCLAAHEQAKTVEEGMLPENPTASLQEPKPAKCHRYNITAHLWCCETSRLKATHTRYCFCVLFVPNGPKAYTHFQEYYLKAISPMIVAINNCERKNLPPVGFSGLSHALVTPAGYQITHTFCPICLFDPNLNWADCMLHIAGWLAMTQHIVSHGKNQNIFQEDKLHCCGFLQCEVDGEPSWFKTADMYNHLHNKHGYNLLVCVDPTHTQCPEDEVLNLRANGAAKGIFYNANILHLRKLLGCNALKYGIVHLGDYCRKKAAAMRDRVFFDKKFAQQNPN